MVSYGRNWIGESKQRKQEINGFTRLPNRTALLDKSDQCTVGCMPCSVLVPAQPIGGIVQFGREAGRLGREADSLSPSRIAGKQGVGRAAYSDGPNTRIGQAHSVSSLLTDSLSPSRIEVSGESDTTWRVGRAVTAIRTCVSSELTAHC